MSTVSPRVIHFKRAAQTEHIYVGRPTKWGNPFVIGRDGTREEVIAEYREMLENSPDLLAALPELRGHNLACWCAPQACHADVLLEFANEPR